MANPAAFDRAVAQLSAAQPLPALLVTAKTLMTLTQANEVDTDKTQAAARKLWNLLQVQETTATTRDSLLQG
jgi:hypothetical protein